MLWNMVIAIGMCDSLSKVPNSFAAIEVRMQIINVTELTVINWRLVISFLIFVKDFLLNIKTTKEINNKIKSEITEANWGPIKNDKIWQMKT